MNRAKPILLLAVGALTLAACSDPGRVPSNDPRANTKQGVVAGTILGAVAGIAVGGDQRTKNAVVGAALGAAVGAAIGDQLDRQAAELRSQLGSNVGIVNTGSELIVTMPQDILFATDSATLQPALQADLRALAANLQRYPNSVVEVVGHTDNTGSAGYNQDLSARRANAVANVLVANGVSAGRIASFGRGENQPIASNLTPEGRQQNRRVEILIRPVN